MSIKLRDLIVKVRGCKTTAEERALIAKECALIRTSFKDSNIAISDYYRPRNLLKLLYIHLSSVNNNGKYPPVAHFGQLESIKLIAKSYFYQKRVGYLSLSVLMSNDGSLMTLVTNSVSLDLQKPLTKTGIFGHEKYGEAELCACLALNCIANVSNSEMVLNLAQTVHQVLKSKRDYLKNKALLCTRKIISKDKDLASDFYDIVLKIFVENNQNSNKAALLGNCVNVFKTIVETNSTNKDIMQLINDNVLPGVIELLTKLATRSFGNPNQGVYEPFLQMRLLEFVSQFGKVMNITDSIASTLILLLEEVPTAKSMGVAVRFECVRCILSLIGHKSSVTGPEKSLDDMAVNMLLDLLVVEEGKDGTGNNQILISLKSINKLLQHKHNRYKSVFSSYDDKFTSYLKNADSSLVKASLDIIFTLLNKTNCEMLSEKVVRYAVKDRALKEHKEYICDKLLSFLKFQTNQYELLNLKVRILLRLLYSCQEEIPSFAANFFVNIALSVSAEFQQDVLIFQSLLFHELVCSNKIEDHSKFIDAFLCLFALKGDSIGSVFGNTCTKLYDDCRQRNNSFPKYHITNGDLVFSSEVMIRDFQMLLGLRELNSTTKGLVLPAMVCLGKFLNNFDHLKLELNRFVRSADVEMKLQARDLLTIVEKGKVNEFSYSDIPDLDAFTIELVPKGPKTIVYGRIEVNNDGENDDDLLALDNMDPVPQNINSTTDVDLFSGDENLLKTSDPKQDISRSDDPFADLVGGM